MAMRDHVHVHALHLWDEPALVPARNEAPVAALQAWRPRGVVPRPFIGSDT